MNHVRKAPGAHRLPLRGEEIKQVVFAGGGNRCFWQCGFWQVAHKALGLQPEEVTSVSAGSALSCAILGGRLEEALELTQAAMGRNPRNRYWNNL